MAIRFKIGDSISVECDTQAEAEFLLQKIVPAPSQQVAMSKPPEETPFGDSDERKRDCLARWWKSLNRVQQRAMKELTNNPNGLSTEVMATLLEVERDQLKYAMRTIRSAAVAAGLTAGSVVESKQVRVNGKNVSRYTMPKESRDILAAEETKNVVGEMFGD